MKSRIKNISICLSLLLSSALLFQNCGEGFKSSHLDSAINNSKSTNRSSEILTLIKAPSGVLNTNEVTIEYKVKPTYKDSVKCLLNGEALQKCNSPLVLQNLSEGSHQLQLYINEKAQETIKKINWEYEKVTSPPPLPPVKPPTVVESQQFFDKLPFLSWLPNSKFAPASVSFDYYPVIIKQISSRHLQFYDSIQSVYPKITLDNCSNLSMSYKNFALFKCFHLTKKLVVGVNLKTFEKKVIHSFNSSFKLHGSINNELILTNLNQETKLTEFYKFSEELGLQKVQGVSYQLSYSSSSYSNFIAFDVTIGKERRSLIYYKNKFTLLNKKLSYSTKKLSVTTKDGLIIKANKDIDFINLTNGSVQSITPSLFSYNQLTNEMRFFIQNRDDASRRFKYYIVKENENPLIKESSCPVRKSSHTIDKMQYTVVDTEEENNYIIIISTRVSGSKKTLKLSFCDVENGSLSHSPQTLDIHERSDFRLSWVSSTYIPSIFTLHSFGSRIKSYIKFNIKTKSSSRISLNEHEKLRSLNFSKNHQVSFTPGTLLYSYKSNSLSLINSSDNLLKKVSLNDGDYLRKLIKINNSQALLIIKNSSEKYEFKIVDDQLNIKLITSISLDRKSTMVTYNFFENLLFLSFGYYMNYYYDINNQSLTKIVINSPVTSTRYHSYLNNDYYLFGESINMVDKSNQLIEITNTDLSKQISQLNKYTPLGLNLYYQKSSLNFSAKYKNEFNLYQYSEDTGIALTNVINSKLSIITRLNQLYKIDDHLYLRGIAQDPSWPRTFTSIKVNTETGDLQNIKHEECVGHIYEVRKINNKIYSLCSFPKATYEYDPTRDSINRSTFNLHNYHSNQASVSVYRHENIIMDLNLDSDPLIDVKHEKFNILAIKQNIYFSGANYLIVLDKNYRGRLLRYQGGDLTLLSSEPENILKLQVSHSKMVAYYEKDQFNGPIGAKLIPPAF